MGEGAGNLFLNRARAFRALLALAESGPFSMAEFEEATGYVWVTAKQLRDELEAWGIVTVEDAIRNGRAGVSIGLTSAGRKVAEVAKPFLHVADRERAPRALLALAEREAMTTREFIEATRYVPENAKKLRDELEAWGLVRVTEAAVNRAAAHRISLTPTGQRAAETFVEVARIVDRAAKS